jgi:hypothetical protein
MSNNTENVRMTKAGLLEAIKDYPDDAPVVIGALGIFAEHIASKHLLGYSEMEPVVWAVSSDPTVIKLEL